MAATLARADSISKTLRRYVGGASANDNESPIVASDLADFDTFEIMSTAGAMDIFVSLDGTNFATAPRSIADLGATTLDPVVVTAANRNYGFRGAFAAIRVDQNGATGVANACLVCRKTGGL